MKTEQFLPGMPLSADEIAKRLQDAHSALQTLKEAHPYCDFRVSYTEGQGIRFHANPYWNSLRSIQKSSK